MILQPPAQAAGVAVGLRVVERIVDIRVQGREAATQTSRRLVQKC